MNADLNAFLRSKKVLEVEQQLAHQAGGSFWCFSIKYLDDCVFNDREKLKTDYKKILTAAEFERFSNLREIRKQIAQEDAIPAYAVFTDEELSGMAKLETITLVNLKTVKNIGEKKVEKYGQRFLSVPK